MQKIILAVLSFFTVFSLCAQGPIDVLHYRFELELNDDNDSLAGRATITVLPKETASSVSFDLAGITRGGKGMILVKAYRAEGDQAISSYTHAGNRLTLMLPQPLQAGDTTSFVISYKGIPADGLIISKNKYGHRTFFADNWPNRGHNWLPCVDDPADKASVEFVVTAPEHYQVVANGIQLEESDLPGNKKLTHWKEDVPLSTKVMVIGVADFAVNLAGEINNCIPVYSWVYPEERVKGFYDYALAKDILPFFIKNVGPYGYKKLANVQSKTTFGGLENANTIFYHENSVTGTRKSEDLMAHEIAHQWFGNMATEKSFAHLWLSEGFATYMTILYMENKYGPDTAHQMLSVDREQVIAFAKNNDRPVVDETKDYMKLLNANSYQKGGWVLHMLRRQLGDQIFWKCIRSYYAAYAGKNADTRDLQKIFEKESGKDLSAFFQQWLYTPGVPRLDISWTYLPKEKKLTVTVKQLQKDAFKFPLDIAWKTSSRNSSKTLTISKPEETFVVPVSEKVMGLVADPRLSLLFKGTVTEKK